MFKGLYTRILALADHRHASWVLGVISFAESSFFPVPPDILLIPMSLARPERAWFYAGICTITSVLGGLVGYGIGYLLYDSLGGWLISLYGYGDKLDEFRHLYAEWGHWIILIKGLTPIPYKLVTIASGFAGYNLFWFVVLSIITRGIRFYVLAGLLGRFGTPIKGFMEKHFGLAMLGMAALVAGGFYLSKYAF